jgi:hypothetical protein
MIMVSHPKICLTFMTVYQTCLVIKKFMVTHPIENMLNFHDYGQPSKDMLNFHDCLPNLFGN